MANVRPFAAIRPKPSLAAKICELPYDVMSSDEAAATASGNPLSFLRVSKAEIELPPGTGIYDPVVYSTAARNFQRLLDQGALLRDAAPAFYLYRQIMGNHSQIGIVGLADCQEYLDGIVKKHEFTRPDKEDDRVRHIEALPAQTGPAFLVYRAQEDIDTRVAQIVQNVPEIDFTAPDGVQHSAWVVSSQEDIERFKQCFTRLPSLYIADGHHRTAAAGRVFKSLKGANGSDGFLAVIFPHNQTRILPYHRVVKDLHGLTQSEFLARLEQVLDPAPNLDHQSSAPRHVSIYLPDGWRCYRFKPALIPESDPVRALDVSLLQELVLAAILDIQDPRRSHRISFVGGIRGTPELERCVKEGGYAVAFAMHPTGIEELLRIADGGGIMPPKSTWFEPKLRDGMFSHSLALA